MDWVFEIAGTDWRLEAVAANDQPGFAAYRRVGDGYELHTLQIFTVTPAGISSQLGLPGSRDLRLLPSGFPTRRTGWSCHELMNTTSA